VGVLGKKGGCCGAFPGGSHGPRQEQRVSAAPRDARGGLPDGEQQSDAELLVGLAQWSLKFMAGAGL